MDIEDVNYSLLTVGIFTIICFLWFVLIVSILELLGWITI